MFIEIQQTTEDIKVLKKYISQIKSPNCYLEIGTFQGGTALLAKMITDEVYSVDSQPQRDPDFNDNLEIGFITKTSEEAVKDWTKSIGVLFIDGNHNEVKKDFELWEKFVAKGGYILIHDYTKNQERIVEDCKEIMKNPNYKIFYTPEVEDRTSILQLQKL